MISSSIAWLDFSQKDRQKMMEVLSLFRIQDTRDELGLASIRDTFADFFFPGTSTLQTRARYFLFVPWLYTDYEQRKTPSAKVTEYLVRDETTLIRVLQNCGELDGVIGQRSGKNLHRFPSSIYWFGLRSWGILRYPGSQEQYHRRLDSFYREREAQIITRANEGSSTEQVTTRYQWDPNLPLKPKTLLQQATFQITLAEAKYLRERVLLSCPRSMLAFLLGSGRPVNGIDFIWHHPQANAFPEELKIWARHAQNFSECMLGASLLYNYLLSKLQGNESWMEMYQERLTEWRENLLERKTELLAWNRQTFWHLVTTQERMIPPATQRFVNQWIDGLLKDHEIADPLQHPDLGTLIENREARLKRQRSRFQSPRHLELWSGAAGTGQLEFRWRVAQRLTNDILEGLAEDGGSYVEHR